MLDKILDFRYQFMVLSLVGAVIHAVASILSLGFLILSIKLGTVDMMANSAVLFLINLFLVFAYLFMHRGIKRKIQKDAQR